jgi:hypothetical protein
MLIYGIDSDDGLMDHVAREVKTCGYFHVISNENGIYSLDTNRNNCRPGKDESFVCKWENNELTWGAAFNWNPL